MSAPVHCASSGRVSFASSPECRVEIAQVSSFWSRPGGSTKNTPSNRSALVNSGGSFEASLQVPTKNTSLSWSLSHVSSEPGTRAVTPESV